MMYEYYIMITSRKEKSNTNGNDRKTQEEDKSDK